MISRMDWVSVIRLCTHEVLTVISRVDYVLHTLVPEKMRRADDNKVGLYPHPVAITSGKYGELLVLDFETLSKMSRLLRLRLHNPVNVTVMKSELQDAHSLFYEKGLAFVCERKMQIRIVEVNKNLGLKPSKLRGMNKNALKEVLNELELDTSDATNLILVQRIESYLENKSQEYKHNNLLGDCINMTQET